MQRRLALLGTTFALATPLGIVAASPASAATYPNSVQSAYIKGCVKGAKSAGVSKKQARTYCRATLKCLQRELTLKEFNAYGVAVSKGDRTPPHSRVIKRCAKAAAKAL